jgi:hypothetical protein
VRSVLDRLSTILILLGSALGSLLLGLLLTGHVLASRYAPGTVRAGEWQLWPRAGAPDADPYSLAVHARRGDLPLAPSEGLALFATQDKDGTPLNGRCTYALEGSMPTARAWTLALYTPKGALLQNGTQPSGLTSGMAAVLPGAPLAVLAPDIAPGNWLRSVRGDPFVVVLRLYETTLTAAAQGLDADRLPRLIRKGCMS